LPVPEIPAKTKMSINANKYTLPHVKLYFAQQTGNDKSVTDVGTTNRNPF
jgi:hypothetical protein